MRQLNPDIIIDNLCELIGKIAHEPDPKLIPLLEQAYQLETSELAQDILSTILQNIEIANSSRIPLCQDTGTLVAFVDLGAELIIPGYTISQIINIALERATIDYGLRRSILIDPLYNRSNTGTNSPAVIHLHQVEGDQLRIKVAMKGGGAENMSRLAMFTPAQGEEEIIAFVVDTVKRAGGRPCPPLIIGVGIGGNFENCALLAKYALLRELDSHHPDPQYAALEKKILDAVNVTGIGPQGMGGRTTALAVKILIAPCHLASLPVAVNIQCHAHRHGELIF